MIKLAHKGEVESLNHLSLEVVKVAGYASIQTTARFYINTSQKDKRDAVELL